MTSRVVIVPLTASLEVGLVVPMPTLPDDVAVKNLAELAPLYCRKNLLASVLSVIICHKLTLSIIRLTPEVRLRLPLELYASIWHIASLLKNPSPFTSN